MSDHNAPDAHGADTPVERAKRLSRYARRLLEAEPHLLDEADLTTPLDRAGMCKRIVPGNVDDHALMQSLRVLRKHVMLRLIARDLGGLATLEEVVMTMSTLAEVAIETTVNHLQLRLADDYGAPIGAESGQVQQLHVIGMGKLGGRELNVSSDIDLVFAYPEDGETGGARPLSNHEFFIRLSRRLIAILNEITADGFVFRVDMRLRPLGADGPLACSFGMLENYFVTQGREWERYAWIKARVLCGDRAPELAALATPFVYRRHLDYSAFESLRDLHRQVRLEVERRDMQDNIKLGPGGIREIEFIAQLFQLVRGGQDTAMRAMKTLDVLPLIAERNLLPSATVEELTQAYVCLRNLEHRLQYLDDKQTQALPQDAADQALIATAMRSENYAGMCHELDHHRAAVTRTFDGIFADSRSDDTPPDALWNSGDHEAQVAKLRGLGFADPVQALTAITGLRNSARVRQMPEASHARMSRLLPLVIEHSAQQDNPDATLGRMLHLVESISRRESYLALLLQFPQTIARGATLASASPWAADYLARHPILLDELLDARNLHSEPDWPKLEAMLARQLAAADDDRERQMDTLRHFKHAQTLHLLAQDLGGELPLERLSDHLSALADMILSASLRLTWRDLRERNHGELRVAPRFIVVAYGKLGGKELGYASDLDLIFLHHDPAPDAAHHYAKLAQRLNSALSSVTPAGVLYETDLRLRPDGASGLLVSPIEGFAAYQRTQAWVWEHQALTRARFVAGDRELGATFETIRVEILRRERDLPALRNEIATMRQTMLDAHPNASGLFDIKHDRGGLIDVEFIVQYLVLGHAHRHAALTANIGNLALLKLAAALGLIDAKSAQAVHDAYRLMRARQHALRLQGVRYARATAAELNGEIKAVCDLYEKVLGTNTPQETGRGGRGP